MIIKFIEFILEICDFFLKGKSNVGNVYYENLILRRLIFFLTLKQFSNKMNEKFYEIIFLNEKNFD